MRIERDNLYLEISELDSVDQDFALYVASGRLGSTIMCWRLSAENTQKLMETCARALDNWRAREGVDEGDDCAKK